MKEQAITKYTLKAWYHTRDQSDLSGYRKAIGSFLERNGLTRRYSSNEAELYKGQTGIAVLKKNRPARGSLVDKILVYTNDNFLTEWFEDCFISVGGCYLDERMRYRKDKLATTL